MVKDSDDLPPKFTEIIYRTKINEFSPKAVSYWLNEFKKCILFIYNLFQLRHRIVQLKCHYRFHRQLWHMIKTHLTPRLFMTSSLAMIAIFFGLTQATVSSI